MHTPGPWRLWPNRERRDPIVCTGHDALTYSGIATVSGDNVADDARLIMAAPELLAFVKRWHDVIVGGDNPASLEGWAKEFHDEATAVLAKAEVR